VIEEFQENARGAAWRNPLSVEAADCGAQI
jgi:hypothetical protein